MQPATYHIPNGRGQAFVLHIWDSLSCGQIEPGKEWPPAWQLINYLTHGAGRRLDLVGKLEWLEYVGSF